MKDSVINRNEAYYSQIEKFGLRKRTVYKIIKSYGKLTDFEISEKMKLPINSITGRRHELAELFFVKELGSKINNTTKLSNTIWILTTPSEREKLVKDAINDLEKEKINLHSDIQWVSEIGRKLLDYRIKQIDKLIKSFK